MSVPPTSLPQRKIVDYTRMNGTSYRKPCGELNEFEVKQLGKIDDSEKTIAILEDRRWPQGTKQEVRPFDDSQVVYGKT